MLVAVMGNFIVHPVTYGCTNKCFPILQSLTEPYDKHVLFCDFEIISSLDTTVVVIYNKLFRLFQHGFIVQWFLPPVIISPLAKSHHERVNFQGKGSWTIVTICKSHRVPVKLLDHFFSGFVDAVSLAK